MNHLLVNIAFRCLILNLSFLASGRRSLLWDLFPIGDVIPAILPHGEIYLVAGKWRQVRGGIFVCKFCGLPYRGSDNNHTHQVFLANGDSCQLISEVQVQFMNGKIWSIVDGSNLKIYYRTLQPNLPFQSICIKVTY